MRGSFPAFIALHFILRLRFGGTVLHAFKLKVFGMHPDNNAITGATGRVPMYMIAFFELLFHVLPGRKTAPVFTYFAPHCIPAAFYGQTVALCRQSCAAYSRLRGGNTVRHTAVSQGIFFGNIECCYGKNNPSHTNR